MTRTEVLLQDKMNKLDCEKIHNNLGKYLDEKFDGFKELINEKLKFSTWIGLAQVAGLISILIGIIVLILKK